MKILAKSFKQLRKTKTGQFRFKPLAFDHIQVSGSFTRISDGQRVLEGEVIIQIECGVTTGGVDHTLQLRLTEEQAAQIKERITQVQSWFDQERNTEIFR